MKKCTFVVLPLVAGALFLSSCQGNPYAGNYTEVEDKTAVNEKLNALIDEEYSEEKKTNYESTLQGKISMSVSYGELSYSMNYDLTSYSLVDSTKDSEGTYTSLTIKAKSTGAEAATVDGSVEFWALKDNSYYNYKLKATSGDNKAEYAGKKIGSSMPQEIASYTSMFNSFNMDLDANSFGDLLYENGVKVYADGENKYKFETIEDGADVTVYLIINQEL